MKLVLTYKSFDWWLWALCLIGIIVALFGYFWGYYFVIGISVFQVLWFWKREKSLVSFNTQVRIVYLLLSLPGLFQPFGYYFYILLCIGTIMVVFMGRCSIAMVLRKMPWNVPEYCSLENQKPVNDQEEYPR